VLDLVPLTVEVTADRLVLTPPRRYRAIGVREQEVPFTEIRLRAALRDRR